MRGRKPKPVNRQIAEGDPSKRGVHKLDQKAAAEPRATVGLPGCPRNVKGRARRAWKFWREELQAMDLDRRPDAMMLEGACVNFARAVEADLIIQDEGMIVEEKALTKEGEPIVLKRRKHPAVEISSRAWTLVRSFCSEFGLSPVARTRLAIGKEGSEADDLMKLLSQPREKKLISKSTVH